jgi:hypothetical protein
MTIISGTGNSRTLALQTTTSGGTATTALSLNATQDATLAGTLTFGTSGSILSGTTGSIGLTATGTNQSIAINPSGTGTVTVTGSNAFVTTNTTGTFGGYRFQTSGNDRWTNAINGSADLIISRFNSSGVFQDNVITMFNASGMVAIGSVGSTGARLKVGGSLSQAAWGLAGTIFQATGSTYTDTSSSGTVASAVGSSFAGPTFAASSATTFTDAATLYIGGAVVAGTNVTLTRTHALWIDSGSFRLDGTTGPGVGLGTLTNAPSAGDPDKWIPINSDGTQYWIPAWAAS